MIGKLLLDTSAVVDLFAVNAAVQPVLIEAEEVFVPPVVLGELFYGARKSARPEANVAQVETFAAASAVLVCDVETSRHYGELKDRLRSKGRPLPENDIWIGAGPAACCRHSGASRNPGSPTAVADDAGFPPARG